MRSLRLAKVEHDCSHRYAAVKRLAEAEQSLAQSCALSEADESRVETLAEAEQRNSQTLSAEACPGREMKLAIFFIPTAMTRLHDVLNVVGTIETPDRQR